MKIKVQLLFHEWSQKDDFRIVECRETPRDERLVTGPIDELHGIIPFHAEIEMDEDEYFALCEALKIGYAPEFRIIDTPECTGEP